MSTEQDGLVDGLARLSFEVGALLTAVAAVEDLSLPQLRLLGILRGRRPRMAELAGRLGTDRSSTTGLIARAEQRGLVVRSTAEGDGRGVHVALTPLGEAFTERVGAAVGARLGALLEPLSTAERRALAGVLETLGLVG